MTFKDKISSAQFVVTSEVGPPKGISLEEVCDGISPLKGRVDAINVTDLQSSVMRMSSLAASIRIKEKGFEPILQMTCRDRNRLALQSDLLSAASFGIENILALTGDHPALGDHPEAKPVFDIDAVMLVEILRTLEKGTDMNGNKLHGTAPRFCVGAAVNPQADPLEPEIIKMEKKIEAGAEFFQTQAVFDIEVFEEFLSRTRHLKTRIIAGIMLLKSERMARYMNEHIPGVIVPETLIAEMEKAGDKKEKCLEVAVRLFGRLQGMCDGIHIMPIGWYGMVPRLLDAVGR
ncbi:MAG: methylenetetrahydrofolate reductase [Candidatus Omnitrophica bacterium]|nr:methylenetetrahydrofolate reductase [Candidatus Omnitrophota bacterium]MDD5574526.1 methylenetetrahydrofolate reductase [Candidatus Omnitrophota bacterium]